MFRTMLNALLRVAGDAAADTVIVTGTNSNDTSASVLGLYARVNVTGSEGVNEAITFNALGGADVITVGDLSGTDVTKVNLNLAGSGGIGDGAADTVNVTGTSGDDVAVVVGDASGTSVFGLAPIVNNTGAEPANDRLVVNALGGDDVVEASGMAAGAIGFTADGGDGDNVLIGGEGNDVLLGGDGDDVLVGGNGLDVLDGGTGDNVVIQ